MPALLTSTSTAQVGLALARACVQGGPVAHVRPIEDQRPAGVSASAGLKRRRQRSASQVKSGHGGARIQQRLAPDRPQPAQRAGYHSDPSRQGGQPSRRLSLTRSPPAEWARRL